MEGFKESCSSESSEIKKLTEEEKQKQEETFQEQQNNYEETCSYISMQENKSQQEDQVDLRQMEDYFNGKTDSPEKSTDTETQLTEKEKILNYGKLSELSYIHLGPDKKEELNITRVDIDPVLLANIDKIFGEDKPPNLSPQEEFLYNYVQENINSNNNGTIQATEQIERVLKQAGLGQEHLQVAELAPEFRQTLIDASPTISLTRKRDLLMRGLDILVKLEQQKLEKKFEALKQDYEIVDYFPRKEDLGEGKKESGLGAMLLEKDGKKILAIRGTEGLSDWRDLLEDGKMLVNSIPDRQVKDLIRFVERTIKPGEKFSITGHSLGGALSQVATAMYADQVEETYTFNSPGVKNMEVDEADMSKVAKLKDFVYNRDSKQVAEKIVNVKGGKWISPIADHGEDIGESEIILKDLASHSMKDIIDYVDKLDENSDELRRKYKKEIKKEKTENNFM